MSYTVLARRYRSQTFDEVIGQEHVAQTLKRAIESGRIAHAYLFCGTRGTGKTSMARILAKALNCKSSDGPTTLPCGKCESCLAIARGDGMDVIEIDAASNTQVDKTREVVIDNAQYRPIGRFKIYIIDEAHMLSKQSFNALLKTLEEPPEHVKFILATTEPEKLLPTILSRCQRYDFRNIPTREIAEHLRNICKSEKIKADEAALLLVAKAGAGSMRDSLSLLDRLLSIGEKQLTIDTIEQLLGMPKAQVMFDLVQAIGEGNIKEVLGRSSKMVASGLSTDAMLANLIEHLRNLLVLRTCGKDSELIEVPGLPMDELGAQADRFDPVVLTQDITILEELRRNLRSTQAGRALLEATLVRLALAEQFSSVQDLLAGVNGNGGTMSPPTSGAPALIKSLSGTPPSTAPAPIKTASAAAASVTPASPAPTSVASGSPAPPSVAPTSVPPTSAPPASVAPASAPALKKNDEPRVAAPAPLLPPVSLSEDVASVVSPASAVQDDDDLPRPGKVWDSSGPSLSELLKQHESPGEPDSANMSTASTGAAGGRAGVCSENLPTQIQTSANTSTTPANIEPVAAADLPKTWQKLLEILSTKGAGIPSILSHGELKSIAGGKATIQFSSPAFAAMLDRNGKKDVIRDELSKLLAAPVGVAIEVAEVEVPAPSPPSAPSPSVARPAASPARAVSRFAAQPAPTPSPISTGIRLTPELKESLRQQNPLIAAIMTELGGEIVKVE